MKSLISPHQDQPVNGHLTTTTNSASTYALRGLPYVHPTFPSNLFHWSEVRLTSGSRSRRKGETLSILSTPHHAYLYNPQLHPLPPQVIKPQLLQPSFRRKGYPAL